MKKIILIVLCFLLTLSSITFTYGEEVHIKLKKISSGQSKIYNTRLTAYDPVGKTAIFCDSANTIYLWYIEDDIVKELGRKNLGSNYEKVFTYNQDGSLAVHHSDNIWTLINVKAGTMESFKIDELRTSKIYFTIFRNNLLFILSNTGVYEYNINNNFLEKITDYDIPTIRAVMSPDGTEFAYCGYGSDSVTTIRNTSDFKVEHVIQARGYLSDMSYSKTGKYFIINNYTKSIFETDEYELIQEHDISGNSSFSNDDSILVIGNKLFIDNDNFSNAYEFNTEDDLPENYLITDDGKYIINFGYKYDANPLTYRLVDIEIQPQNINIDLSKETSIDIKVVGVYNNGDKKPINNSEIKFLFGDFLKGSLVNGKLNIKGVCDTYLRAEYKGFKDEVSVFASKTPEKLTLSNNLLKWEKISEASAYNIYRKNYEEKDYKSTPINEFPIHDNTFFDDYAFNNEGEYSYVVTALYNNIESAYSNEVNNKKIEVEISLQIGTPYMFVNGKSVQIDDNGTVPIIKNSRTLLPIRAIIEQLGGTIYWNGNEQKIEIVLGETSILINIGKNAAIVNGENKSLDVAPEIYNGRTMVPVRFVTENLNCQIEWDPVNSIVKILYRNF